MQSFTENSRVPGCLLQASRPQKRHLDLGGDCGRGDHGIGQIGRRLYVL